jgi:TolB-like protein
VLAHEGGRGAYREALVEKGRALFERAMPERVRERMRATTRRTVRLHVEDTLVHVPWELLHDGADFLGCKFSFGRMVSARADTAVPPPSSSASELVVIANPSGDLPHADEEGRVVEKLLSSSAPGRVVHASGPLSRADFLRLVKRARVLHFAGHVTRNDSESAFVLQDGTVSAREIASTFASQSANGAPSLVFANACHASTNKWNVDSASLAQALLLAGVRHTLAPMWSVPDADALAFALRFYESALAGVPFGECARRARKALLQSEAAPLSFAGYVLYGDPRATLPPDDANLPALTRTRSGDFPPVEPTAPTTSAPRSPHSTIASTAVTATDAARAPPALLEGRENRSHLAFGAVGGIVTGAVVIGVLALHPWTTSAVAGSGAHDPPVGNVPSTTSVLAPASHDPNASGAPTTSAASTRVMHTGPVRVSVMPWKSGDPALRDGLTEVVSTALSDHGSEVQLIERGQIDVDVGEIDFEQTKYVDANTKAQLGKIAGCEVAILGGAQPAGDQLRLTARFVDVETGEVLAAAKVDGKRDDLFALEDKLAAEVKRTMHDVARKLRNAR